MGRVTPLGTWVLGMPAVWHAYQASRGGSRTLSCWLFAAQVTILGFVFGEVTEVELRQSESMMRGRHHGPRRGSTSGTIRVSWPEV